MLAINNALSLVVLVLVSYQIRKFILPPSNFPKNIPTIPFYVVFFQLYARWAGLDQETLFNRFFREKLEKHGAVKVYFASQWNVLVSRPEFVKQIVRNDDIFEKSGNQHKIPQAVVSEYLGENFISAGNELWRRFRRIGQHSIQFPDLSPLEDNLADLVGDLQSEISKAGSIAVPNILQKFALGCIGDCLIGCDLKTVPEGTISFHDQIIYLKKQIFRPLFMNFPVLDYFPFSSRVKARKAVRQFKNLYIEKILEERSAENSARLGPTLAKCYENGEISRKQFEDNSTIAMIAGHENPQILLTNVLYLLSKHPETQKKLRESLQNQGAENNVLLTCVIYESLRLLPPLGQLINRMTRKPVILGENICLPKGIYVGSNSFFTQRDRGYWKDADSFLPGRWGSTMEEVKAKYRAAKILFTLTAFSGGKRACLGEKFALQEVTLAVSRIVTLFSFVLDPNWKEQLTPIGPIWPVNLTLRMKEVKSEKDD